MTIVIGDDGWIVGVERVPTPHTFGPIEPELVVWHETGTRITPGACVRYCTAPKRTNPIRVGYHAAVERNGKIVQMASFKKKVRHAGISEWFGKKYCNAFSIGIGIVGPTELKGTAEKAKAFFGKYKRDRYGKRRFFAKIFKAEDGLAQVDSPYHGKGHVWLEYSRAQLETADALALALKKKYPGIENRGHYEVSPGRKIDPNPMLDIQALGADEAVEHPEAIVKQPPDPPVAVPAPVAPAAPPVVPAVAKADDTHKTMKEQSREYNAADLLEKGAKIVVGLGGAKVAADNAEPSQLIPDTQFLEALKVMKSYMDLIAGMIATYGFEMMVVGGIGVAVGGYLIKRWKRQSYDAGLYTPSGEEAE